MTFDLFWQAYPRKIGKRVALKSYNRADAPHDEIMAGLERSKAHWMAEGTQPQFIPHPATWLNQGRWEDEYETSFNSGIGKDWWERVEPIRRH